MACSKGPQNGIEPKHGQHCSTVHFVSMLYFWYRLVAASPRACRILFFFLTFFLEIYAGRVLGERQLQVSIMLMSVRVQLRHIGWINTKTHYLGVLARLGDVQLSTILDRLTRVHVFLKVKLKSDWHNKSDFFQHQAKLLTVLLKTCIIMEEKWKSKILHIAFIHEEIFSFCYKVHNLFSVWNSSAM